MYERPNMQVVTELAEGVFMASGAQADEGKRKCSHGRDEFNKGSDKCQCCSATGGKYDDEDQIPVWEAKSMGYKTDASGKVQSFGPTDATVCPENMPIKG
ncbi:MAG: hypothetical protein SPG09_10855 [Lachnospiraceae bacterium]|nr:hypothetical protein [bacterium]MDY5518092.1 hypothetical protein [Lachnospiraceae bacterium]